MSAPKVKNLVILILALVNLFLLALVLPSRYAARQAEQEANRQLSRLFSTSGIRLDPESIPRGELLCDQVVTTDASAGSAAVLALLGEDATAERTADGLRFSSGLGTATLVDGVLSAAVSIPSDQPEQFTLQCLRNMGIGFSALAPVSGGEGTQKFRADLAAGKHPVHDAALTFSYENGALVRVDGLLLAKDPPLVPDGSQSCLSPRDALVKFLGSRLSTGWLGSSIQKLEQVWLLSRSGSSLSLRPAWRIHTDAGLCLVNGITGEVTLLG